VQGTGSPSTLHNCCLAGPSFLRLTSSPDTRILQYLCVGTPRSEDLASSLNAQTSVLRNMVILREPHGLNHSICLQLTLSHAFFTSPSTLIIGARFQQLLDAAHSNISLHDCLFELVESLVQGDSSNGKVKWVKVTFRPKQR
jgi:hypothetical protein